MGLERTPRCWSGSITEVIFDLKRERRAILLPHHYQESEIQELTDSIGDSMELAPEKKFYFVANEQCNCSECPHMKRNTLEKLRDCLLNQEPRLELTEDLVAGALKPLQRMLAVR